MASGGHWVLFQEPEKGRKLLSAFDRELLALLILSRRPAYTDHKPLTFFLNRDW